MISRSMAPFTTAISSLLAFMENQSLGSCRAAACGCVDRESERGQGENRQTMWEKVHRGAGEGRTEQRADAPDESHNRVDAHQVGAVEAAADQRHH
jgi:hypothetical protein